MITPTKNDLPRDEEQLEPPLQGLPMRGHIDPGRRSQARFALG